VVPWDSIPDLPQPPADICLPDCNGKVCGDDGCGGNCGECMNWCDPHCDLAEVPYSDPSLCMQDGTLCAQVCCPNCCGKQCGNDGCGGLCGQCEGPQEMCDQGQCLCQPICDGVECGDDGCGGSCGACDDGWHCSPQGLCEPPCVPEGGTLVPDGEASCCNGLVAVSFCHPVETGSDCDGSCPCHEDSCVCSDSLTAGPGDGAEQVPAPQYDCSGCLLAVCTACGDGECGPGENQCNCQPDCGYPNCWEEYLHPDSDWDGVPDVLDICPWVFDPWQANFDWDSLGDACDPDDDNDGTPDTVDCKRFDPGFPACHGKQCGDDGCGGSCGVCADGWLCSPQGLCEF